MVLNQLMQSPKWTKAHPNIEVGEIVLMKEDNTPLMVWRKARVIETFPGKDEYVRVVLVNDAKQTVFKRSIRKVVRLPVVVRLAGKYQRSHSLSSKEIPGNIQGHILFNHRSQPNNEHREISSIEVKIIRHSFGNDFKFDTNRRKL